MRRRDAEHAERLGRTVGGGEELAEGSNMNPLSVVNASKFSSSG